MSAITEASTAVERMAENLRTAAALLDAHPDLPAPYITTNTTSGHVRVSWYLQHHYKGDLTAQRDAARRIIRALGRHWDKEPNSLGMSFTQGEEFVSPVFLDVLVTREAVCERVVTGTEQVTIPAVAAQPERVETRETVEWICEPVLAEAVAS